MEFVILFTGSRLALKSTKLTYFEQLRKGFKTTVKGLQLTLKHLSKSGNSRKVHAVENQRYFDHVAGLETLQYPYSQIPVPDQGRYRLHNEMDDCIVCDKCAKVCPVNCIDIEPIKATETFGKTSDGTPKRLYAAVFDIDMAKCCFCGLCTTVCPTECLTMTKVYDFPEFDIRDMNYHFSNLSPEQAEEKRLAASVVEQKSKLVRGDTNQGGEVSEDTNLGKTGEDTKQSEEGQLQVKKPVFKPRMPLKKLNESPAESTKLVSDRPELKGGEGLPIANTSVEAASSPKPVFKPKMKPVGPGETTSNSDVTPAEIAKKPVFKPKMKPVIKPPDTPNQDKPISNE